MRTRSVAGDDGARGYRPDRLTIAQGDTPRRSQHYSGRASGCLPTVGVEERTLAALIPMHAADERVTLIVGPALEICELFVVHEKLG